MITASVTLAALATAIWLPLALLGAKRSGWAWMTLAMLAMLWRGEAWKTVCLREQAQLSQCLQQQPKTGFSGLGSSLADGGRYFAGMSFSQQFGPPITQFSLRQHETGPDVHEERNTHPENRRASLAAFRLTFCPASLYPALCPDTPSKISPEGRPQGDQIIPSAELPYPIGGNTSSFHMTYIV
jgi:hypothetical protein